MITPQHQDDGFAISRNTTKQAFTCHDLNGPLMFSIFS
jgi:hypothetical protein